MGILWDGDAKCLGIWLSGDGMEMQESWYMVVW